MKFSTTAVLFAGVVAAWKPTLTKRQSVSAVNADVGAISASAVALDTAVKGFNSASQAQSLITDANNVVDALNKAVTDTNAIAGDISIDDPGLTDLINNVQALAGVVQTTVSDLIAKKAAFASFALCPSVLAQASSLQSGANTFESALIPKLASGLTMAAAVLVAPINTALSSAIGAFQSCPAAVSTPGSTPTSSPTLTSTPPPPENTSSTSSVVITSSMDTGSTTSTPTTVVTSTGVVVITSSGVTVSTVEPLTTVSTISSIIPIITPSSNVTGPSNGTTTPSPTITPAQGAGVKQVVGLGGLIAALLAAVVAL